MHGFTADSHALCVRVEASPQTQPRRSAIGEGLAYACWSRRSVAYFSSDSRDPRITFIATNLYASPKCKNVALGGTIK